MSMPIEQKDDDEIYGGLEVGEYQRPKSIQSKFDAFKERALEGGKEVVGQIAKNVTAGALGGYGDLASLIGINPAEGYITPGEKARYESESNILEKMQKPGYKPSFTDLYGLSSDDDIAPQLSRLPQTGEIKEKIEDLGGPGSPIFPEGEVAQRASQIYGNGLAFGMVNPVPALAGGTAGETAKFLGAGPIGQTVAEIAAMLATQGRSNPLTSTNPAIRSRIESLRKAGYNDQDITLAINAAKSGSNRVKGAKATSASENAFEGTLAKSEGLFQDVLSDVFPGIEKGVPHLHQVARDAYGQVARGARNLRIKDPSRFQKTADNVVKRLKNTLGENTEAAPFIKRIEDAATAAHGNPTADTFINFYQELNEMGKWVDPKNRERLITHVKDGIKSTFRNAGPEGKQLANQFEEVNRGVQRAYQAEAVTDLLGQAFTVEGIDWNKTLKLFDKQKNWDVLEKGLGHTQTQNLRQIAKVGKDVGDFRKSLGTLQKGGKLSGWINTAKGAGFVYALANGHYKSAALLAGGHLSKEAYSRLQTRLLTDPKFQNVFLRTLNAIKTSSPQALQRSSNALRDIAQEEGIDVDSF